MSKKYNKSVVGIPVGIASSAVQLKTCTKTAEIKRYKLMSIITIGH